MRVRAIAVLTVALLGCSSPPPREAKTPEPTESEREIESLIAEGARLNAAKQYREAADRFKSAIVIDPKNVRAQYDLAIALENAGDPKGAAEAYERTLQLAPRLALVHQHLGEVRLALGDRAAARRELDAAASLEPRSSETWIAIGRVEVEDGHPEVAVRRLERGVTLVDDPDVWFHLGLARELAKDPKGAGDAYERALKMDPRHAVALNNQALLRAAARDLDGAIGLWRRAIEAQPRYAPAQKNLGIALYKDKGAGYLALPHLRAYVELGGDDRRVKTWVAEIVEATKTYRSSDRASAVFDRFENGEVVTADQRFALKDASVAEKGKALRRGDRVLVFFDSPTGTKVSEIRPAK